MLLELFRCLKRHAETNNLYSHVQLCRYGFKTSHRQHINCSILCLFVAGIYVIATAIFNPLWLETAKNRSKEINQNKTKT